MLIADSATREPVDSALRSLQAHGLLVAMIVICIVGLVVIVMLLRAWRRYNSRLNREQPKPQPLTDVWRAAAERLSDPNTSEPDEPDTTNDR